MFLLFEIAGQGLIFAFMPESLGVLIFGITLVLLAVSLRWLMKRNEKGVSGEIHTTE